MKIKYGLFENAIDSLRHCVGHLVTNKSVSQSDLKRGIIDAVHVVELLLKERLKQINEAFIWMDIDKYPNPDSPKVGLKLTVERLKKLGKIDFDVEDNRAINLAAEIRNKFTHYEIELDGKDLQALLAQLLGFVFRFSDGHLKQDLRPRFKREWNLIVQLIASWPSHSSGVIDGLLTAGLPLWEFEKTSVTEQISSGKQKIAQLIKDSYFLFDYQEVKSAEGKAIGKIELLRDRRITNKLNISDVNNWPREGQWEVVHYLPAIVRSVDNQGKETNRITLERPLATLKKAEITPFDSVYFLTVDYSIGAGSYNGPISFLCTILNGKVCLLESKGENEEWRQISLMNSLKSTWLVKDRNTILKMNCVPGDPQFQTHYTKYVFGDNYWRRITRQKDGFWECDTPDEFLETGILPTN